MKIVGLPIRGKALILSLPFNVFVWVAITRKVPVPSELKFLIKLPNSDNHSIQD